MVLYGCQEVNSIVFGSNRILVHVVCAIRVHVRREHSSLCLIHGANWSKLDADDRCLRLPAFICVQCQEW